MQLKTTMAEVVSLVDRYKNRPSVKQAMLELFGEMPDNHRLLNLEGINNSELKKIFNNAGLTADLMQVRGAGSLKDKSFYLNQNYNWEIVMDDEGNMCLTVAN